MNVWFAWILQSRAGHAPDARDAGECFGELSSAANSAAIASLNTTAVVVVVVVVVSLSISPSSAIQKIAVEAEIREALAMEMSGDKWCSLDEVLARPSAVELMVDRLAVVMEQVRLWCKIGGPGHSPHRSSSASESGVTVGNTKMIQYAQQVARDTEETLRQALQEVERQQVRPKSSQKEMLPCLLTRRKKKK